jgi:hypothetical protein
MMKGSVRRINSHGYEQKSYLIGFNSSLNIFSSWAKQYNYLFYATASETP